MPGRACGVTPVQLLTELVRRARPSSATPALSSRLCAGLQLFSQPHTRSHASLHAVGTVVFHKRAAMQGPPPQLKYSTAVSS